MGIATIEPISRAANSMNRSIRYGLAGITLAFAVSSAGVAHAQLPMPELFGPEPTETIPQGPVASEEVDGDVDSVQPAAETAAETFTEQVIAPAPMTLSRPEPAVEKPALISDAVGLIDSVPSSSDLSVSKPTVMELRQARAQYRQQQRLERMERNLWSGYEPLRPNWNSIPMMSSRYPDRHTVVVPVYFYAR